MWENRQNTHAALVRPSFSVSDSAHLAAIVCIFRSRLSQFKHNYAYVSHSQA